MPPIDWQLVLEILGKLGLAVFLGGIVGLEREIHGRPAGIRTHMMLIIGVTLFCETSKHFGGTEPARIAAQVVTGVGFLGAGTILRLGAEIKGLTTAASLWAVAAIGMAVSTGGSFMVIAIIATLMSVITLAVVDNVERKIAPNAHPRALNLILTDREKLSAVIENIDKSGGKVLGVRLMDGAVGQVVQLDIQGKHAAVLASTVNCNGVVQANWSD